MLEEILLSTLDPILTCMGNAIETCYKLHLTYTLVLSYHVSIAQKNWKLQRTNNLKKRALEGKFRKGLRLDWALQKVGYPNPRRSGLSTTTYLTAPGLTFRTKGWRRPHLVVLSGTLAELSSRSLMTNPFNEGKFLSIYGVFWFELS